VITSIGGSIVDTGGYLLLEVFFIVWLCVSLVMVLLLWVSDPEGRLNMSPNTRRIYEDRRRLLEHLDSHNNEVVPDDD